MKIGIPMFFMTKNIKNRPNLGKMDIVRFWQSMLICTR